MMPKAQRQFDPIGALQSERVFRAAYLAGKRAVDVRRTNVMVEGAQQLSDLLYQLGVRPNTAAIECYAHVNGATARAATSIAEWMAYLPADCVRAMVRDGWHWST